MYSTKVLKIGATVFGVCVIANSAASQTGPLAAHDIESMRGGLVHFADASKFQHLSPRHDQETLEFHENTVSSETGGTWSRDYTPLGTDHGYPGDSEITADHDGSVPSEWLETY